MTTRDHIRADVSEAYTRALQTAAGPSSCCGAEPKGVAAKLAGYDRTALEELPPDAVANSFGCGDPVAMSRIAEGDVVIDLGCGAGIDLLIAARRVSPNGRVIGIDMTDAMLDRARANVAAAQLTNVEVRKGIIEALPVDTGSADWVISNCVINLSPEKDRVFAEIARVLKPGGQMSVSDIVVESLPEAVRNSAALYHSCIAGAISEAAYVEGLRTAGLSDVRVDHRAYYEPAQLVALVESELAPDGAGEGSTAAVTRDELQRLAASVAGKVWSARVYARKPG